MELEELSRGGKLRWRHEPENIGWVSKKQLFGSEKIMKRAWRLEGAWNDQECGRVG